MNYEKDKSKELGAKKNYFSKKFASFFDKKYQCLLWWFTTIAIVILYLEKGYVVIFKMDFY